MDGIDQALTRNPVLWAKIGELAGIPIRPGKQPCPFPGHQHSTDTTL